MVTVRQIKAARQLLGWSQADLARHADLSVATIGMHEATDEELGGSQETQALIISAFRRAGIVFLSDGEIGVTLRAKRR
jgi:DNA-binding XRE family transcriptional regulator